MIAPTIPDPASVNNICCQVAREGSRSSAILQTAPICLHGFFYFLIHMGMHAGDTPHGYALPWLDHSSRG